MTEPDIFFSKLAHANQTAITILKTHLHVSAAITDKVPRAIDSAERDQFLVIQLCEKYKTFPNAFSVADATTCPAARAAAPDTKKAFPIQPINCTVLLLCTALFYNTVGQRD